MFRSACWYLFQVFLLLLVVGLLFAACSSDSMTGPSRHCSDADYPLWCSTNNACCPPGYPVNCGGRCYTTRDAARSACDARVDTCYRE